MSQQRRRPGPPSLQGDEVPSRLPSPRKGYCSGLQCTCDSDGEERPRTPLGGYDSPPRKKPKQGQGYKHHDVQRKMIAKFQRARGVKQRRAILTKAPSGFIRLLNNLARRLVSGTVRVTQKQRRRLLPHRKRLIKFSKIKNLSQLRRRVSENPQKGGILPIIPFLLGLGPLIAKGLAFGAASAAGGVAIKKAFGSGQHEQVPQTGSGAFRRGWRSFD